MRPTSDRWSLQRDYGFRDVVVVAQLPAISSLILLLIIVLTVAVIIMRIELAIIVATVFVPLMVMIISVPSLLLLMPVTLVVVTLVVGTTHPYGDEVHVIQCGFAWPTWRR